MVPEDTTEMASAPGLRRDRVPRPGSDDERAAREMDVGRGEPAAQEIVAVGEMVIDEN